MAGIIGRQRKNVYACFTIYTNKITFGNWIYRKIIVFFVQSFIFLYGLIIIIVNVNYSLIIGYIESQLNKKRLNTNSIDIPSPSLD